MRVSRSKNRPASMLPIGRLRLGEVLPRSCSGVAVFVDALRTQDLAADAVHAINQATVQLVTGIAVGQGRRDIPGRAADRERHVGFDIQPRAAADTDAVGLTAAVAGVL